MPDPTAEKLAEVTARYPGNVEAAQADVEASRRADLSDPTLRNVQHALQTRMGLETLQGNPLAQLGVAAAVPAWSGAKLLAQKTPVGRVVPALTQESGASAPSLEEVKWGLEPLWRGARGISEDFIKLATEIERLISVGEAGAAP